MRLRQILFLVLAVFGMELVSAATVEVNPELLTKAWSAKWIRADGNSDSEYGVYLFRREVEMERRPERFVVHVSADCRYKLYVNGELVSLGPAAGDLFNWNYETVDIAAELEVGNNTVAAVVWNGGKNRPEAQISNRTGFILQGDGETERVLDTGTRWKAKRSSSYAPIWGIGHSGYYVAGPGEERDLRKEEIGWLGSAYDDVYWKFAEEVPVGWPRSGKPKGLRDASGWMLVPRGIPFLDLMPQRFNSVRRFDGVASADQVLEEEGFVHVAANSHATFLLDQGSLTNAYPRIEFEGGRDATIELVYAESLFEEIPQYSAPMKGNRDVVEGKQLQGRRDRVIGRGSEGQVFEPLSWRTFRYVEVRIVTGEEPIEINQVSSVFVGYPFELNARFQSRNVELERILEIGWRTARLCSVETYMDCPYYEQLQYIGDTRIQALVSLFNSGDDRLLRNALNLADQSIIAEGVTMSRHPSKTPQIIPTFSLWYIGMLHDYWMYGDDAGFVGEKLEGVRSVLGFFHRFQGDDGRLKKPPYWLFTDWVNGEEGWDFGEAPFGSEGESAVLDLTLLWSYQLAAELEDRLGMAAFAELYTERASVLKASIREAYWDADSGVMLDTRSGRTISQHANALAILTGTLDRTESRALALVLERGEGMAEATIYFKYYVYLALKKAGMGDHYLSWLDKWRENMAMGLTTWAETSEVSSSRSDCHAWGASPNIEFYRIVLGIDSAAAGFRRVRIEPHLGDLDEVSGSIPHPSGKLSVAYSKSGNTFKARIELPEGIDGVFVWGGIEYPLASGDNEFSF